MRIDDFNSYMKQHVKPVLPDQAYDAKIRATLNSLPSETKKNKNHKQARILAVNALVLAIVLVFILPGSEAILSTEWLYAHPSEDAEQYVIEGRVFEPEIIERADADNQDRFVTSSYEEFSAYLECDLKIPRTLLSSWTIDEFICTNTFAGKSFSVYYINPAMGQEKLAYSMRWVISPEDTISIYELMVADGDGWYENVGDQRVLVQHLDDSSFSYTWTYKNCEFGLHGPLSLREMDAIASEIMSIFDSLPIEVQNKCI